MTSNHLQAIRSLRIERDSTEAPQTARRPVWRKALLISGLLLLAGVAAAAVYVDGTWRSFWKSPVVVPTSISKTPDKGLSADSPPEMPGRSVQAAANFAVTGYTIARRNTSVSSETGGRVTEVLFDEGQSVKQGDILVRIDSALARNDVDNAGAQVVAAQAARTMAEVDEEDAEQGRARAERLIASNAISRADLTTTVTRENSTKAKLAQADAQLQVASVTLRRAEYVLTLYDVRAPIAGVVTKRSVEPGEVVSVPSSTAAAETRTTLATLIDRRSLEVEAEVNESFLSQMPLGTRASVTFDAVPNLTIGAKVLLIVPTANRDKATIKVRLALDEIDPRLFPDMTARVSFQSITAQMSSVTASAAPLGRKPDVKR